MKIKQPDLVLGNSYALGRLNNPELVFRYRLRARMVMYAAKKYLGSCGPFRILDLGAAEGKALLELRTLLPFGEYAGVEYSEELTRLKNELPKDVRIVKGDVMNLPEEIKGRPYNIVSAMALLGHLANPLGAVSEAAGVLCDGGIFVATCSHPFWEIVSARLGLLKEEPHVSGISKQFLIDIVQKAGLEFLNYERFMWAPVAILSYLKISVSPGASITVDKIMRRVKIFNWLFINQCIIARKPLCHA